LLVILFTRLKWWGGWVTRDAGEEMRGEVEDSKDLRNVRLGWGGVEAGIEEIEEIWGGVEEETVGMVEEIEGL
jgi:hypothetical protein